MLPGQPDDVPGLPEEDMSMKVPGVCSVCGKVATPTYSCILCGAEVCDRDFFPEKNICKRCSSKWLG